MVWILRETIPLIDDACCVHLTLMIWHGRVGSVRQRGKQNCEKTSNANVTSQSAWLELNEKRWKERSESVIQGRLLTRTDSNSLPMPLHDVPSGVVQGRLLTRINSSGLPMPLHDASLKMKTTLLP